MLRPLVRLLLRLLYGVEIQGEFTTAPRLLIIANHQSLLDAVLLWAFLPVESTWMVHKIIAAHWWFRWPLKLVDHLVVDTASPFAMKVAVLAIEGGKPLVIFPEGRLTATGSLMKIYEGPAFIAARSQAAIQPVWIDGCERMRLFSRVPLGYPRQWLPKIRLSYLAPASIPMPEAPNAKERRRLAGEAMRRLMQNMQVAARVPRTLPEAFLLAARNNGMNRRMVEEPTGGLFTYRRLVQAMLALGRMTSRLSEPDESVGVLMPNVGATIGLVLGLLSRRRIAAILNYTAGVDGMRSAMRAAKIRTVLSSRTFLERARLADLPSRIPEVRWVYLEELRQTFTWGDKLWLLLVAQWFPRVYVDGARPQDAAIVLFTSGSEGKPKGVVLSHDNVLANIAQIHAVLELSPLDKVLAAMPMFHSFGLTGGVLLPLLRGMRIFIYPTPLHYRLIPELAYDRDCTILFATNTFLGHYARRAHAYDFRSIRYVVAGAEKLTDEVRRLYSDRFGVRILEGYGATECSPVIAANTPMASRAGTVGEILPGMEYRLEPVEGIPEGGLLHVRGPNVMVGYWREENPGVLEPPASRFGSGWYNTGDIATVDADGMLRLLGRARRFAKIAGEMVSLEVVEKLAEAASPRWMHAATTLPDPRRGEMIVLVTQDQNLRRDQLQEAAHRLGVAELAIPRRIVAVGSIPLLGNGKKDYPAVRRLLSEGALVGDGAA